MIELTTAGRGRGPSCQPRSKSSYDGCELVLFRSCVLLPSLNSEFMRSSSMSLLRSSDLAISLRTSRNGLARRSPSGPLVVSKSGGNPASAHGTERPSRPVKVPDCCSEPSFKRSRIEKIRRCAARRSIRSVRILRRMAERGGDVALLFSAALEGRSDSTGATNNLQDKVNKCTMLRERGRHYCDEYAKHEARIIKQRMCAFATFAACLCVDIVKRWRQRQDRSTGASLRWRDGNEGNGRVEKNKDALTGGPWLI
jgi:hypothetical protein